jgi:hypothetical protein
VTHYPHDRLLTLTLLLAEGFLRMEAKMSDFGALSTAVDANTAAVDAAIVLIQSLKDDIAALQGATVDQAVIDDLAAKVNAAVDKLRATA